ncbi:MAG: hypothetical protein ACRDG5_00450, partial [Anaerolineales bacterium]
GLSPNSLAPGQAKMRRATEEGTPGPGNDHGRPEDPGAQGRGRRKKDPIATVTGTVTPTPTLTVTPTPTALIP